MTRLFLPDAAVKTALQGMSRLHPKIISVNTEPLYVIANDRAPLRRVGLVSGGGSGHEPLHTGFVGRGMLDAAAPGAIFASPHNRQIFDASLHVAGPDGVLHIVKNYTGDRINFGIAAERLRDRGVAVERVLVDDDIATDNEDTATGRRGTAATVFVEKILGAAADEGTPLDELARAGTDLTSRIRSIAVASRSQTTMTGGPAFDLADDRLEYGVGIHGERAATSIAFVGVESLVVKMLDDLLANIAPQSGLAVLVNGLGATTHIELAAIAQLASSYLDEREIRLLDISAGTLVPALDMSGFSLTVAALDDRELTWWNAPCTTTEWRIA